MTSLAPSPSWSNDLAVSTRDCNGNSSSAGSSIPHRISSNLMVDGTAKNERNGPTATDSVRNHLGEPAELIRQLASQNQLLACLKWLGEFQVLACIPLSGDILAKEVAELAGVPEALLCRIYRMTTTFGFLHEPKPGYIAHTSLSSPFVVDLSLFDAVMFLAETAAPTALQMTTVTSRQEEIDTSNDSAYSVAFSTSKSFTEACMEHSRLQRQWSAYRQCAEDTADVAEQWVGRLSWRSLGSACVVDVCASSTDVASALVQLNPALRVIAQLSEPSKNGSNNGNIEESLSQDNRVTVQRRTPGEAQTVKDAAVYILRLSKPSDFLSTYITAELKAHLEVLRANSRATLILASPFLPEPGTVGVANETLARLQDLYHLQLNNEFRLELEELKRLVDGVHDTGGRLAVAKKLRSPNGTLVAVGIIYEPKPFS